MSKLDKDKPFGIITGHARAHYEQDGQLFNAQGEVVEPPGVMKSSEDGAAIPTDELDSAKQFLMNILKGRSLPKAEIYKEAESNNQVWDNVKNALVEIGAVKVMVGKTETWKLSEK